MTQRVAVLGAGKMGEALLSGMLRSGTAPGDVVVTARRPERAADACARRYGVQVVRTAEAATTADTLILTVKPQDMGALLDELAPDVPGRPARRVGRGRHHHVVHRGAARAGHPGGAGHVQHPGAGRRGDERDLGRRARRPRSTWSRTEAIFSPVGRTIRVPESQQDAVTALSGSGPAYFFYLVEAMTDAGILLGLPRQVAHDLIVQTAIGSAVMLRDSGERPATLREAVTSPAGTTINAIREMENHGVRAAMLSALEAARDRGRELASGGRGGKP